MKKRKSIIALLLSAVLLMTACGGSETASTSAEKGAETTAAVTEAQPAADALNVNAKGNLTTVSVNADRSLSIAKTRRADTAMGAADSWSIFLYLCGTDLETGNGFATANLQELLAATYGSNVKFVIETGGTQQWQNSMIEGSHNQRFVAENGQLTKVADLESRNMGDSSTLSDFLTWGVQTYPAERMGVIFWDHGNGSIEGVCFDELNNYDSLLLPELSAAFNGASAAMTDKFEFIGFDACLMANIETAAALAPFARYLYASEETEPGGGWDYTSFMNYLGKNPSADGEALGKVVVDGFYDKCALYGLQDSATLSVTKLSEIEALINAFEAVASEMSGAVSVTEQFAAISKSAYRSLAFGAASDSEGYSNLVDLGDMISNISDSVENEQACLDAINNAIVYMKNGSVYSKATGLSVFYPIKLTDNSPLTVYEQIGVSPSYIKYIDAVAFGANNSGIDNYTGDYFSDDGDFWSWDESDSNGDYWNDYYSDTNSGINYIESGDVISLDETAHFNENNVYTMTIAPESLPYVNEVFFQLYLEAEGGAYSLGYDNDLFFDTETGVVEDNFRGIWPCLPDGGLLALEYVYGADGVNLYNSAIYLNGELKYLDLAYVWSDDGSSGQYVFLGISDGIDENGAASRTDELALELGDVIAPAYLYLDYETCEFSLEKGGDYTVIDPDFTIEEMHLPASDYSYAFNIVDIFSVDYWSDFVGMYVDEDGQIYAATSDELGLNDDSVETVSGDYNDYGDYIGDEYDDSDDGYDESYDDSGEYYDGYDDSDDYFEDDDYVA